MKSFIFGTSFVDSSISRYAYYIRYYRKKLESFGAENLFLIDDSSNLDRLRGMNFDGLFDAELFFDRIFDKGKTYCVRFGEHLGNPVQKYAVPKVSYDGWWRSFLFSVKIAKDYDYDKIIHIETDAYILSKRLAEYIKNLSDGWTVLWTGRYKFPEASIQVICKDQFNTLNSLQGNMDWIIKRKMMAERLLPFTRIVKTFMGDRYGESDMVLPERFDYCCQATDEMAQSFSKMGLK